MEKVAEIPDILGRKRVVETILFGNLLQDFSGTFLCSDGLKGPPGMTCIRKNVMVIRIKRDNTPATNRLIMYFAIAIPPLS